MITGTRGLSSPLTPAMMPNQLYFLASLIGLNWTQRLNSG
jgi:hypothetical protein